MRAGRIESLRVPTNPLDVGLVAFEIARRHRFVEEIAEVPDSVRLHVLPSGTDKAPTTSVPLGRGTMAKVEDRMARAFDATSAYLDGTTR